LCAAGKGNSEMVLRLSKAGVHEKTKWILTLHHLKFGAEDTE
jgi:hypothetical protein